MEPSEEIRQVVTRFFEALRDGDEEAVGNRVSRQTGFERFGTDPDEVWRDGDTAARVWVQQMRELGGRYPWRMIDEVHAMLEGTVGWAAVRTHVDSPVDVFVEYRFTCVLHLEHGEWKIVHWHSSVPTRNEEHGFFLTKSVDDIAEAVNESRPDLSATSAPDGTVTIAFTDIEDSRRVHARVRIRPPGTDVRPGDRARDRRRVQRTGIADPRPDRHPRGRDRPGGGRLLRPRRELRGPDRLGRRGRRDRRLRARPRAGGKDRWVHLEEPRHVELKGIDGPQEVYPLTVDTPEPLVAVD